MKIRLRKNGRTDAAAAEAHGAQVARQGVAGRTMGHRQFLKMLAGAAGVAGVASLALGAKTAEAADGTFDNLTVQGGLLQMTNGTSNLINFGAHGYAAPSSTAGWKVKLWDAGNLTDSYGIGIEGYHAWIQFYTGLKLYSRGTLMMYVYNDGGTATLKLGSQKIADAGGCYYA